MFYCTFCYDCCIFFCSACCLVDSWWKGTLRAVFCSLYLSYVSYSSIHAGSSVNLVWHPSAIRLRLVYCFVWSDISASQGSNSFAQYGGNSIFYMLRNRIFSSDPLGFSRMGCISRNQLSEQNQIILRVHFDWNPIAAGICFDYSSNCRINRALIFSGCGHFVIRGEQE